MSARKRWEYRAVDVGDVLGRPFVCPVAISIDGMGRLADAGRDGWELIGFVLESTSGIKVAMMKREIVDE